MLASKLPILEKEKRREEKRICATEKKTCWLQSSVHVQSHLCPQKICSCCCKLSAVRGFRRGPFPLLSSAMAACGLFMNDRSDSRS